ncbi:hypothetical protein A2631_04465 [Candidatus Daviesbacteria bacterium RIFCSPHIGHO2_01_FULL_44_29]|nr:MAG: hypothetical protein A2631_04465 [Candidatus Daviesbacteria bacterium RIFCSPHIGHO2_01_FULL_44_29]OGE70343.1 MAG: hypothetical protein A3B55_01375 [Candidatus Daviesbacteria bacterium RIFCSPLOWO2_01_FULL_43_15]
MQVALPFIEYQTWEVQAIDKNSLLVSPQALGEVKGVSIKDTGDFSAFISDNAAPDYISYSFFNISIPSLRIDDLKIKVSSNDVEAGPAQLPGTAFPGERGNIFVSGHSSLPQLSLRQVKPPFSVLPKIKRGDQIFVNAGGQEFTYIVEGLRIVDPKEISVINPPDAMGRYLTLMTCVPPGLNTKRLIVLSKLQQ